MTGPTILVQRLMASAQMPRYAHAGAYGDLAADLFAAEAATLAPVGEVGSGEAERRAPDSRASRRVSKVARAVGSWMASGPSEKRCSMRDSKLDIEL